MIHGQLPLPVPCYDFALLTELTLAPPSKLYAFLLLSYSIEGGVLGAPSSLGVTGEKKLLSNFSFPPSMQISRTRRAPTL